MRQISDLELSVVIPLLASKLRDLRAEFAAADGGSENGRQLQEMVYQYEHILESLRKEYEKGLAEGQDLPSFDSLIAPFEN